MKSLPHPIPYQGSKRNLAHLILNYFPNEIDCLIEPFAGSAAISIAAATRQLANTYWLNDLNKPLSELLRLIVESPEEIASCYEQIWQEQANDSIEHYYKIRDEFNRTPDPRRFLYLLARCVKGSVRYNSEGRFNQSPDKRRQGTRPETMRANIYGMSVLLKDKSQFTAIDYRAVLRKARVNDLVYMDPPYQGVCGNHDSRYWSGIDHEALVIALAQLNSREISYIISYDGRRGDKTFGELLPSSLHLIRVELKAGRSSQSTLLGRDEVTYESLYLSRALINRLAHKYTEGRKLGVQQHALFESHARYA